MPTAVIPSTFNRVSGHLSPDAPDSIRDPKHQYFLRIDQCLTFSSLPARRQWQLFAMAWIWRISLFRTVKIEHAVVLVRPVFFEVKEMLSPIIQRLKRIWHSLGPLSMVLAGSALLSGCAALGFGQSKPPITVSEVVQMSKENVPAETIVNKMRDSETVYRLNAAQLAQLHDQGVADLVLNYMQETYFGAVRREQDQADWSTWEMWHDHFW